MINVKQWMNLTREVRVQIAKDFNLPKTGGTSVANNIIISDGHLQPDLEKINVQNLQAILDSSEENFEVLFSDYKSIVQDSLTVVHTHEPVIVTPVEEYNPNVLEPVIVTPVEEYNPNVSASGDKETYFGTKIKPVTYTIHDKKTKTRK